MTTCHCSHLPEAPWEKLGSSRTIKLESGSHAPMGNIDCKSSTLPGKVVDDGSIIASRQKQHGTQTYCSTVVDSLGTTSLPLPSSPAERPMCRICHEGSAQEELLSPCECAGTLGTIHRSCLEHWLSTSSSSFCELCHFQFSVQRKARPLLEWIRNPGLQQEKRTLFGDMICFLLITPLATISGWLCLRGAMDHLHFSSRLEAVGLIALTVALFTIYLFWTLVSLRYHCRLYSEWRQTNQRVVLLLPRSHSNTSAQRALVGPAHFSRRAKDSPV